MNTRTTTYAIPLLVLMTAAAISACNAGGRRGGSGPACFPACAAGQSCVVTDATTGATACTGTPTGPVDDEGMGCNELDECVGDCGGDEACGEACAADATSLGLALYNAVWDCAARNGCQDMSCVAQNCAAEINACLGDVGDDRPGPGPTDPGPTDPGPTDPGPTDPGPTDPGPTDPSGLSCLELDACLADCDGNEACFDRCEAEASSRAITLFNAIWECAGQHGCQDMSCVNQRCGAEINACVGDDPVGPGPGAGADGSCEQLYGCLMDCPAGNGACTGACSNQASPEAMQTLENLLACARTRCEHANTDAELDQCVLSMCSTELNACFSG